MRIGLDLRSVGEPETRLERAVEADRLGLWAVLVGGPPGTEVSEASMIAVVTEHVHLAVQLDGEADHPRTLAEEVAVLDHLSVRRALAVVDAQPAIVDDIDRLLAGEIVDGVALTPPPAQTNVPVWRAGDISCAELTGDLDLDRPTIDERRDGGCTHLFVSWPGPLHVLARHIVTRASTADFPQMVADMADVIDPPPAHR